MAKYWVANNPNSEINDAKAQKLADLSATTASVSDLNNIASSSATAAERDYRTMVVDCGAAGGSGSVYAVVPYACNVVTAHLVLQGAEDGSGTYGLALENNASTAMGSGAFTVAQSAAAGTVYSVTPATNNSFTAGQKIEFLKSSSSGGGTPGLMVTLVLELT
jgi:hypothetical protein